MYKFSVKIQRKSIDTTIVDMSVQVCQSYMTVITQGWSEPRIICNLRNVLMDRWILELINTKFWYILIIRGFKFIYMTSINKDSILKLSATKGIYLKWFMSIQVMYKNIISKWKYRRIYSQLAQTDNAKASVANELMTFLRNETAY